MTKQAAKQSQADAPIEDTGERMVPAYHKGKLVYGEHIVRYEGARELVKGKTVLDIASGSGYGTALLAETAKKVYGVDVNEAAIDYATKNYDTNNIKFLLSDGVDIPLEDKSVDVVISLETIEHIEDYKHFMSEVKRVLTDDGLFILSTPNDVEFPEGAHFHIHEFEHKELQKLAGKYFSNNKEYFQVTWIYNALVDEDQVKNEWVQDIKTINTVPVDLKRVLYFYMLCSNREVKETIQPLAAISEHWSTRDMLTHNNEMDKYIKDTIKHYEVIIKAKDKHAADLRDENAKLNDSIVHLQKHLKRNIGYRAKRKLGNVLSKPKQ